MSRNSITDVAGASPSHPDTAELMGATLRAPIASSPQMLGSVGGRESGCRYRISVVDRLGGGLRFSPLSLLTHY